ncbi:hypothetical protein BDA96_04G244700 [Sorghum bicolor]|uniref:No apical meristem-associated C-terminal domain-containing protein n=1 Tax=Sorghum bicolor TaxID=4558 RepID=A0A921UJ52_SORBI|nr:hypothetical protein BDA96_04G244400 [Sorghum bicolor]KAG0534043.1 hypothetical protein BDA96_04G244700 [Sorghum bicolor]
MTGQPSQGFSTDNNHGSQEPPSLKSQRAAKKKNVSRRGTAFTKEEDLVVCSAFLNISKDLLLTSGGYYKRMHDYFNEHKPEGSNRSQIAIQHRWALIQKAMNKFCGHKAAIDSKMYEKTEPFTIMHCWRKLCNEAKWSNKFLELNNSASLDGMSSPPTQGHAESGNQNTDTSRPEGRDSAKRPVEVLQRLQEKSEKTEQMQDQQMVEILSRKDEKIKIQRDLFNLQKKHMKMSTSRRSPYLKNYYLGMQRQIMERRGFSGLENED